MMAEYLKQGKIDIILGLQGERRWQPGVDYQYGGYYLMIGPFEKKTDATWYAAVGQHANDVDRLRKLEELRVAIQTELAMGSRSFSATKALIDELEKE